MNIQQQEHDAILFPRKKKNQEATTQKQQPEEILSMNRARVRRKRTDNFNQSKVRKVSGRWSILSSVAIAQIHTQQIVAGEEQENPE